MEEIGSTEVQVKFGEWFEKGFNLYKENLGLLILASLIAVVLSAVTLGILLGPMMAGMILICLGLRDRREPRPEVGEVFKGFNYFLQSFLFVVVWGLALFIASFLLALVPCVGQVASLALVFAVQTLLMFAPYLIVDRNEGFWAASVESYEKVKTNFFPFLGFSVVVGIVGSLGAILCGIGVVLTAPVQACVIAVAYRDVFRGGAADVPEAAEEMDSGAGPKPPESEGAA
ncbi:MAG: hypothetical protein DRH20_08905 [Deltaproteobacteria bacterium]|nr:MAG: hypothetical protein DRH20_08905 [Deltaproteobacteria bacterium]